MQGSAGCLLFICEPAPFGVEYEVQRGAAKEPQARRADFV